MASRMPRRGVATVLALGLAGVCFLAGCRGPEAEAAFEDPAKVEKVAGQPARITLAEKAVRRLGVETASLEPGAGGMLTVPVAAVLYDADGQTFVYTNPRPNVFVRADITVADIVDDTARLSAGPPAGTKVVTVAAAELFGVETGLGASH